MRTRETVAALLVAVIALVTFLLRLRLSFSISEPLGVDGYYYAVQLRELLSRGRLYYPASPLAFWLLAPFAALLGPIAGLKVGAALFSSLAAFPAAYLAQRATRQPESAILAALVTGGAVSASILSTEFVKQSIGVTVALFCVAAVVAWVGRRSTASAALALSLLIAAFLTHATAGVVAIIFAAPVVLASLRERMTPRQWQSCIAASFTLFAIALAVAWTRSSVLRGLFGVSNRGTIDPTWSIEAIAAAVTLAVGILVTLRTRDRTAVVRVALPICAGAIALTLLLNLPWLNVTDPYGVAPRLLLLGFVPLAILLPIVITATGPAARHAHPIAALLLVPTLFIAPNINDRVRMIAAPDVAPALSRLASILPYDALLITQSHREAFQVKWFTGREATSRPPRDILADRTFRFLVASTFPRQAHRAFVEFEKRRSVEGVIHPLPRRHDSIIVVPENVWTAFVRNSAPEIRKLIEPWPDEIGRVQRSTTLASQLPP